MHNSKNSSTFAGLNHQKIHIMKKYLLLLVLVFCGIVISTAQTQYEVIASSSLNVRNYASKDGYVLGKLHRGEKVDVYAINNGWAQIRYNNRTAYVNVKYLKKSSVQPTPTLQKENSQSSFLDIDLQKYETGDVEWIAFVLLALSLLLWFLRKFVRGEEDGIDGGFLYYFNWIIFLLTCGFEIVYVVKMGSDTTWFCSPNYVGWLWTIINFIIFGFLVYNQILCFLGTLLDVNTFTGGGYEIKVGYYSWIIFLVTAYIMGCAYWDEYVIWAFIPFAICQLIQIILIFKGIVPYGGWLNAILATLIYGIGSLATVIMLLHFLVLLIIVIIAIFFLSAFASSSSSSSSSSSNSSSSSETPPPVITPTSEMNADGSGYIDRDGEWGRRSGQFSDDNTFHEYGGPTWRRQANGDWERD